MELLLPTLSGAFAGAGLIAGFFFMYKSYRNADASTQFVVFSVVLFVVIFSALQFATYLAGLQS